MKQTNNVRLYNKKNFNQFLRGKKLSRNGEFQLAKALFLLEFDGDPDAQTEGLQLLKKACDLKYEPAIQKAKEIKKNNEYKEARKMYKFVFGKEII